MNAISAIVGLIRFRYGAPSITVHARKLLRVFNWIFDGFLPGCMGDALGRL